MDGTVHFHYCITLSIIRTVLKNVDRTINFYYCTALPNIRTVLKNQACNIYKYWSYNRNLRVNEIGLRYEVNSKRAIAPPPPLGSDGPVS